MPKRTPGPRSKRGRPQKILDWFEANPGGQLTQREFFELFNVKTKTYATEILRSLAADGIERVMVIRRKP
ncbi:hypothetical protein C1M51_02865 [Methylibium sp. Pch-M]|nr:hypothetical protein C1M51_02865 [Methylibium sp. Pch-M]